MQFGCTFKKFIEEFKSIFNKNADQAGVSYRQWSLRQGHRSVAKFSIEFCTLAATSGWNSFALKRTFFHAVSEPIKDELALLDEPESINELITLATRLDNHLKERRMQRNTRGKLMGPILDILLPAVLQFNNDSLPLTALTDSGCEQNLIDHSRHPSKFGDSPCARTN